MENGKEEKKVAPKKKEVSEKKVTSKTTKTSKDRQKVKFTKKEKTQLIVILLVIVVAIVGIVLFITLKKSAKNDGSQENTEIVGNAEINNSKGVTEDKQIDDLKITNTQVKKENGITYIYADVVNTGSQEQGNFYVFISMKDKDDKEIIGFETMLPMIKPGETSNIKVGSADEFVNAYRCTMVKVEDVKKPK